MRELAGVTATLLGPLLATEGHRPRLISYLGGGRTELSTTSLANWSSKVAGLLTDELGAKVGDLVYVGLPAGWQTAPVLLGTWWTGLAVSTVDSPDAVASFVPDGPDSGRLGLADEVFVVSGHPLGAPSRNVAPGQRDFTAAVLPQADRFSPRGTLPLSVLALTGAADLSVADVITSAEKTAAAMGSGVRVLSTLPWTLPSPAIELLLGCLAADGTLIQVGPQDPKSLQRTAVSEKATHTAGVDVPGLPRLDL